MNDSASQQQSTIRPSRVRYIKLGEAGRWEKECLEKSIIRFGFGSARPERFALCISRNWSELTASFIADGRSKGVATRFTNEVRTFFEDPGSILWITFIGQQMYWGFVDPKPTHQDPTGDGVWRGIAGGWRASDLNGDRLTKDRLSGALTKLAAYRGTSCDVDVSDYVVRRIKKILAVEQAIANLGKIEASVRELLTLLEPRDFELLVDLVFSASGWRRLGVVGKTQKTLDLDLVLPSTGERAFVQVKSKTSSAELAEYVKAMEGTAYDRMFYVFHSGQAETNDDRVTVVGPEKLGSMVVEAGLVNWLIRKTS